MNLNVNYINYGLIKEKNFTIALCKNGQIIMVFQCTQHITYNEGKSVVAERFIKMLKGKIYKK